METKRSQSIRKAATPKVSKTRMPPKTLSQASMTPSQASETARMAANGGDKNPLDALSRSTMRSGYERRCGLQDIDEEYLKRVAMPPPALPRQDYAAGRRTAPQAPSLQGTNLARSVGGGAETAAQQQQQQTNMTQQEQQLAQAQPQQAQQQMQAEMPPPQQQQMQPPQQMQSPQQVNYMPAAGEPELCTTCPHCQTTIYLARAPEPMPAQTIPGIHGQPEGANLAAAK